ncbi:MAG: methyltransferase domain-containing protein, partial [Candidatus Dormibacteraeota bacterium]|nr:methyltransferase domain-containing protein [Candidatus Dormibacteraeota bacterium]
MPSPRQGEWLGNVVLGPFAEQLLSALAIAPGDVVCELMCDVGVLSRELAPATGRTGTLILADSDASLAEAGATAQRRWCKARALTIDGPRIPVDDAICDRVTSLINIQFADTEALLDDALRVLRPGGSGAFVLWDPDEPPAY